MPFEPKNFDSLLGTKGLSDALLKNHFTLYQGYVINANKLADSLASMLKDGKTSVPEFAELARRFGWEFNGMRLHELYFGNIAKNGAVPDKGSALLKQMAKDFGSYDAWEKSMRAIASMRGIGWAVLYYDISAKRLFNCWINEHDAGHLCGAVPILAIDVFEHAFMTDYGIRRADYINTLFAAIDWAAASARFWG